MSILFDLNVLEKIVQSPFVWAILCLIVAMIYFQTNKADVARLRKQADSRERSITKLYEEHKKESNLREEKLMNHLEKTTHTLENIEKGLSNLESKIEGGFSEVWEQIDSLKKKKG